AQRGVQELHVGDARAVAQQLETRLHHLADELLLAVELPVRLQTGEQLGEQALSAARPGRLSWQQLGSFLPRVRPSAIVPGSAAGCELAARAGARLSSRPWRRRASCCAASGRS